MTARAAETELIEMNGALPAIHPMPTNIHSTQPGGGMIQALELGWGRARRSLLKTLRPAYVAAMKTKLKGDPSGCPVEIIDARDLKYFKNVCDCWFEPEDDGLAWRSRLGVARAGLAELVLLGGGFALLAIVLATGVAGPFWLAVFPSLLTVFVAYFFRDPERVIPAEPGVVVSPADGKVVAIEDVDDPEFVGEPALKIGIFLSVFNVHVNRCPTAGQVIRLEYQPGEFLNALYARSAEENERMTIWFADPEAPHRRFVVKQIAGAIARRIVCELKPGERVTRGQRFGMIKFGSRTEILLPRKGFELSVRVGDVVQGASTQLGRYVVAPESERLQ